MKRLSVVILLIAIGILWWSKSPKETLAEVKISPLAEATASTESSLATIQFERLPFEERNHKDWIDQLPTKSDLQQLTNSEVHSMPAIVMAAADELTSYAETVRNTPSLRGEALSFFKGCAEKDSVVDSLRAYCFAKAVTLQLELEGRVWDPQNVPKNIKELATQL